jgi:lysophospholipase L1-like esterase
MDGPSCFLSWQSVPCCRRRTQRQNECMRRSVQGIVRLARKTRGTASGIGGQTPEVLVIAPPPIGEKYIDTSIGKSMGSQCNTKSLGLAEHLESLLKGTDIHFADSKSHISMNEIDYMHLDTDGHRKMANFVWGQVTSILKER